VTRHKFEALAGRIAEETQKTKGETASIRLNISSRVLVRLAAGSGCPLHHVAMGVCSDSSAAHVGWYRLDSLDVINCCS